MEKLFIFLLDDSLTQYSFEQHSTPNNNDLDMRMRRYRFYEFKNMIESIQYTREMLRKAVGKEQRELSRENLIETIDMEPRDLSREKLSDKELISSLNEIMIKMDDCLARLKGLCFEVI